MTKERFIEAGISEETAEILACESAEEIAAKEKDFNEKMQQFKDQADEEKNSLTDEIRKMKIDFAARNAVNEAGAVNSSIVMNVLDDFIKNAEIDEEGNVKGLNEKIAAIKESEETSFLFKKTENIFSGITPESSDEKIRDAVSNGAMYAEKYGRKFGRE